MPDRINTTDAEQSLQSNAFLPNFTFDIYTHLPFQIAVLMHYIRQVTTDVFVKESGVSGREWRVLAMLGCVGPTRPAMVADITGMDRATVTRAIARLAKLGYVFTGPDVEDGRRKLIYLTQKGADKCDEDLPKMAERGKQFEDVLTAQEIEQFRNIINKLQEKAISLREID